MIQIQMRALLSRAATTPSHTPHPIPDPPHTQISSFSRIRGSGFLCVRWILVRPFKQRQRTCSSESILYYIVPQPWKVRIWLEMSFQPNGPNLCGERLLTDGSQENWWMKAHWPQPMSVLYSSGNRSRNFLLWATKKTQFWRRTNLVWFIYRVHHGTRV